MFLMRMSNFEEESKEPSHMLRTPGLSVFGVSDFNVILCEQEASLVENLKFHVCCSKMEKSFGLLTN